MHDVHVRHAGILQLGFYDEHVRHVGSKGVKRPILAILRHGLEI